MCLFHGNIFKVAVTWKREGRFMHAYALWLGPRGGGWTQSHCDPCPPISPQGERKMIQCNHSCSIKMFIDCLVVRMSVDWILMTKTGACPLFTVHGSHRAIVHIRSAQYSRTGG